MNHPDVNLSHNLATGTEVVISQGGGGIRVAVSIVTASRNRPAPRPKLALSRAARKRRIAGRGAIIHKGDWHA